jgi:alpha-L-fucosidase
MPGISQPESAEKQAERYEWFNEAKFGMFVHWGLYSVPARNNKGPYVSWMMEQEGIPVSEYDKYADRFKPAKFDAAKWFEILQSAGMRYMVFTSKHHEGFCMFDSALTDYNSVDRAAGCDFVRELVDAGRKAGVKTGFYYSMLDWHHPDFEKDMPKYIDYMHDQVRELCSNYGAIDFLWFDGEWDHPLATWRSTELVEMIRGLQPNAVVNDRLGKGERGETPLADFYTREQMSEIGHAAEFEKSRTYPWEACLTIGTSWGYKEGDGPLKDTRELVHTLVDIASRGGNLLLNVGPTSDGEIPEPLVSRLREMGKWMDVNGEAIYGTTKWRVPSEGEWIRYTCKGDAVYAICLEPPEGFLLLEAPKAGDRTTVSLLGHHRPLEWKNVDGHLQIEVPRLEDEELPLGHARVFKLEAVR